MCRKAKKSEQWLVSLQMNLFGQRKSEKCYIISSGVSILNEHVSLTRLKWFMCKFII